MLAHLVPKYHPEWTAQWRKICITLIVFSGAISFSVAIMEELSPGKSEQIINILCIIILPQVSLFWVTCIDVAVMSM